MDTRESTQSLSVTSGQHPVLRTIAAAIVAILISVSVSNFGRSQGWPHAQSIGLATFVFLIPVLPTIFKVRGSRSVPQSIVVGLIFALIGGFIHALAVTR